MPPIKKRPPIQAPARTMADLLAIMAKLRNPQQGCPWDVAQNFDSIAPYTIEEAYEVADAISRKDKGALKDELGDLLFQVVFHARMAEENGDFAFADVVAAICDKMERRHPHVFGDAKIADASAQTVAWENMKAAERAAGHGDKPSSALDGIAGGLPSLLQAEKLQRRAARVGFDWTEAKDVIGKIREELDEVAHEFENDADGSNAVRLTDELGDLLFACVNLARKANIDSGMALRGTNLKFERRFRRIEALLAEAGKRPEQATLAEMEDLWMRAKREEQSSD